MIYTVSARYLCVQRLRKRVTQDGAQIEAQYTEVGVSEGLWFYCLQLILILKVIISSIGYPQTYTKVHWE